MQTRAERFERLVNEELDLLIIGGGINGAGAARDAAQRGLKVALVERRDWAAGTSSRSAKLVHGGLRYLATFQLGLVRESTAERAVQMKVAPHLVKPLEFLMPVYADHKHGLGFMNLGLWLYDTLALFRIPKRHRSYRGTKALTLQPNLRTDGLRGALTFFDTAANDARLTLENALDAEALGALTINYARVSDLERDDDGRVTGAVVTDELTGQRFAARAKLVLNTTGPWTDRLLDLAGDRERPMLRPTKGAHLVVRAARLPMQRAVALIHPKDQRPLFAIPWGPHVYLGTTDFDLDSVPDDIYATAEDRDNILEAVNHYFPEAALTPADIVGSWCGIRPLVAPDAEMSASKVSREHVIEEGPPGLLTMAGGKFTTYRLMARELVDTAAKMLRKRPGFTQKIPGCQTKGRPLPGAVGIRSQEDLDALATRLTETEKLSPAVAKHLAHTYGVRAQDVLKASGGEADLEPICPPLSYVWAEIRYAIEAEHACTLEDFLARRTQLSLRDPDGALEVIDAVAERMGTLLGWNTARIAEQQALGTRELQRAIECRH